MCNGVRLTELRERRAEKERLRKLTTGWKEGQRSKECGIRRSVCSEWEKGMEGNEVELVLL